MYDLTRLWNILIGFRQLINVGCLSRCLYGLLLREIFYFNCNGPYGLLAHLLLFSNVRPFIAVPRYPLYVRAVISVVDNFAIAASSFHSTCHIANFLVQAIHRVLSYTRQRAKG